MAEATTKLVSVELPVVRVTETRIVLTLTEEEAGVLRYICNYIGGSSEGPRRQIDNIREALNDAGVKPGHPHAYGLHKGRSRGGVKDGIELLWQADLS